MRITGPGIWGDPADRDGAIALLKSKDFELPLQFENFRD